jgi:hypothetical protein
VGHTTVRGEPALKLTFCNPATEERQVCELLDTITACGRKMIDERQSQNDDSIACDLSTPCLG